tara:strand:+ start:518 stop:817 length:300 start_codon:yes stop_codon:yes gene_type:complete
MKRYATTPKKIDKSGIRVYGTTYYPEILISDMDTFIYPVEGERLDSLAHKSYGDVTLWWVIAKANGIKGKPALSSDEMIRIPGDIVNIIEKFVNINTAG